MPTTLTLKNIPDEVYARLKLSAETHRRSMNSEAIFCLEAALLPSVVAYLYLPGEYTTAAEALLEHDPDWAVPVLWRSVPQHPGWLSEAKDAHIRPSLQPAERG